MRQKLRILAASFLIGSAFGRVGVDPSEQEPDLDHTPILQHRKLFIKNDRERITHQYIVVLKPEVSNIVQKAKSLLRDSDAKLEFTYEKAIRGFTASGLVIQFLLRVLEDDAVEYVEEDMIIHEDNDHTQRYPTNWGLDKIDSCASLMDNEYTYEYTGKGVEVYILDSGVNLQHEEFEGRISCGYNAVNTEDCDDYRGHGSHVAGIAAGQNFGVAKDATIIAVKVLNSKGSGSLSGVLSGIDFVATEKAARKSQPMVANMSLGGGKSNAVNGAVMGAVAEGVVFAVSAGNDADDACNKSPASAATVIAVGAIDDNDIRKSFSNMGPCVDIFAPGDGIISAWYGTTTGTQSLSGTSMATPFVTGAAALYLERDPTMTPDEVRTALQSDGAIGVVSNIDSNTVNISLCVQNLRSSPTQSPTPSPTASPTSIPTSFPTTRQPTPSPKGKSQEHPNKGPSLRPTQSATSRPTLKPTPLPASATTPTPTVTLVVTQKPTIPPNRDPDVPDETNDDDGSNNEACWIFGSACDKNDNKCCSDRCIFSRCFFF